MSTVYLFTGENAFALRQEKLRWIAEFVGKHGAENALQIDGSHIVLRELLDEVSSAPFIAAKRLVVVQGLPKLTKEEMQVLLNSVHPECILLFTDPAPDKRLGGYKLLITVATVKDFPPLRGNALQDWMNKECVRLGGNIEPRAIQSLLAIVGENQDMLAQELAKLSTAARGTITATDVEKLAVPSGEQEIWQLTTLLSQGDLPRALRYAQSLLRSGEDAYSLWSVLLWLLRCLTSVALCVAEGEKNPAKIASMAGVPFPTAKMLAPMTQGIPLELLRDLVEWAVNADRHLKTGGYRSTADAPQELVALIDELIIRCCNLRQKSAVMR